MSESTYQDPCTIALQYEQFYQDMLDWDDLLTPEEYLDRLDQRNYEKSNPYA